MPRPCCPPAHMGLLGTGGSWVTDPPKWHGPQEHVPLGILLPVRQENGPPNTWSGSGPRAAFPCCIPGCFALFLLSSKTCWGHGEAHIQLCPRSCECRVVLIVTPHPTSVTVTHPHHHTTTALSTLLWHVKPATSSVTRFHCKGCLVLRSRIAPSTPCCSPPGVQAPPWRWTPLGHRGAWSRPQGRQPRQLFIPAGA